MEITSLVTVDRLPLLSIELMVTMFTTVERAVVSTALNR